MRIRSQAPLAYILLISILAPASILFGAGLLKNTLLTLILFHGGICILPPLIEMKINRRHSLKKIFQILGFKNFAVAGASGVKAGLVFAAIIFLFFFLFHDRLIDIKKIERLLSTWNFTIEHSLFFSVFMAIGNSFFEETLWRGYVYHKLVILKGIRFTVLFTAIFYASYHFFIAAMLFSVGIAALFTIAVFLAGVFWGYLRNRTDSLWAPFVSHFLVGISLMISHHLFIVNQMVA